MRSKANHEASGYLRSVAVNAVNPFRYRSGVRTLLGMPDAEEGRLASSASSAATGLRDLRHVLKSGPREALFPPAAEADPHAAIGKSHRRGDPLACGTATAMRDGAQPRCSVRSTGDETVIAPPGGGRTGASEKDEAETGRTVEITQQKDEPCTRISRVIPGASDRDSYTSLLSPKASPQMPGLSPSVVSGGTAIPPVLGHEGCSSELRPQEKKIHRETVPVAEIRSTAPAPPAKAIRRPDARDNERREALAAMHPVNARVAEGSGLSHGEDEGNVSVRAHAPVRPVQTVRATKHGRSRADSGVPAAVNARGPSPDGLLDTIGHIRRALHEREAKQGTLRGEPREEPREAGTGRPPFPPVKQVIVVNRTSRRGGSTPAFWERSYLGRFYLRIMR